MFDGPDWVGKSTQIELAAQALRDHGYEVYTTRINGGTPIGEALRHLYLDAKLQRPRKTDLHMLLAVYYALIDDLQARRQAAPGTVYLVDRSPLSMFAYHAYGGGLPIEGQAATEETLRLFNPSLLIYYTAPPVVLKARRQARTATAGESPDFVESQPATFMRRVIEGYADAAERYGAQTIDASGDLVAVHHATMACLTPVLPPVIS